MRKRVAREVSCMCMYCSYSYHDGWTKLLEFDDVYQRAHPQPVTSQSTHGFHDSWHELKEELNL